MKKLFITLLVALITNSAIQAKEGMWLPLLLKSLNEADMQRMGLKLSAEDIYSVNQSSLKDAVVSFGGFCTGEIISDQGLILTNHHCGYGKIQSHSSVENDYLTNGFWAMNHSEELKNPGLTATFIVRMEDVTNAVLEGISSDLTNKERDDILSKRIDSITEIATTDTHYEAYIRPFFYGNEYYMFVTETFKDVRMVGAPPSSIGKFGGDTDNWMWPRHTGDFSLFRIYADSNNMPAEYNENNVPYKPKHYFPISLDGYKQGDFTMVYGFPGRTQEYLTSYAIKQIKEVINPAQIDIRDKALEVLQKHMKASDEVRIKYASKYASISNYWKKWIGENRGLQKTDAIEMKLQLEEAFINATKDEDEFDELLNAFKVCYDSIEKYSLARSYFVEIPYRKIEIIGLANSFKSILEKVEKEEEIEPASLDRLKDRVEAHFKDYDLATDKELAQVLLRKYKNEMPSKFTPQFLSTADLSKEINSMYEKSIFTNKATLIKYIDDFNPSKFKKLARDPAYDLMTQFWSIYFDEVRPDYNRLSNEIDSLSKIYIAGLRIYVPDKYYPDANSTLRLAYGKVEDFEPADAVEYAYYTDAQGIIEKYDPDSDDFDLPGDLVELIEAKNYGPYAREDGQLPVCFIASNHTTGGNSGSPVINARGELIGLNFDRNWEGTMSDINYDISQCRNIAVDIRYVLFVVDKFANASHLVEEMKLVQTDKVSEDEN
ncbi:MAG: S46 family peptidase [Vicingaceae bacterium]